MQKPSQKCVLRATAPLVGASVSRSRPVDYEGLRSATSGVVFRTPQHQLGQGRHRPEGPIRCERNTSPPRACRRGRPRSDHPAEQPIAERLGFAPQAKVFASSVARDRNPVGSVGREAAGEEVCGTFVVGIPSGRSACIKQVLVEVEAVGGFTSAGKPPPELLCRSGIRSYGLVCCA